MAYVYQEFPKWKYRNGEQKLIQNAEQEEALGPEWTGSPADVYNPNDPPKPDPGIVDEVELDSTGSKQVSAPHYRKHSKKDDFSEGF